MRVWVRNKKGSLSLSMEAIVILILAVVMLGLALTFVRGIFTKMGGNIDKTLDLSNLDRQPSEAEPVVISPSSPTLKYKGQTDIAAGFYNPSVQEKKWMMLVYASSDEDNSGDPCVGDGTPCGKEQFNILYNKKPFMLEKDKAIAKPINVRADNDAAISDGSGTSSVMVAEKTHLYTVEYCSVNEETTPGECDGDGESYTKDFSIIVRR